MLLASPRRSVQEERWRDDECVGQRAGLHVPYFLFYYDVIKTPPPHPFGSESHFLSWTVGQLARSALALVSADPVSGELGVRVIYDFGEDESAKRFFQVFSAPGGAKWSLGEFQLSNPKLCCFILKIPVRQ